MRPDTYITIDNITFHIQFYSNDIDGSWNGWIKRDNNQFRLSFQDIRKGIQLPRDKSWLTWAIQELSQYRSLYKTAIIAVKKYPFLV